MRPVRYVVKSGDTLWDIAGAHLGDPVRWPDLYAFNNRPDIVAATHRRIVDPNRIFAGQTIFLPPPRERAHRRAGAAGQAARAPQMTGALAPAAAASAVPQRPLVPQGARNNASPAHPATIGNPAAETLVNDFAHTFYLEREVMEVRGAGFTAVLRLRGSISLQRTARVPLVVYSNKGAEVQARSQSAQLLGQLIAASSTKVGWDPRSNRVTYESALTLRAGVDQPATQLSAGVNSRGEPVLKATVVYPRFTGRIADRAFVAHEFKVDVELKVDQDARRNPPQGAPVTAPAPRAAARADDGWLWGAALVGAGIIVIGATLAEDFVTAGAGVADDPATLAAGAGLLARGRAVMQLATAAAQPTPVAVGTR